LGIGDPPFVRPSVQAVLAAHVNDSVPPQPRASRAVETLVLQMLLKDAAARIPTMEAVVETIDEYSFGRGVHAAPLALWRVIVAQS
jgi:hypothetical protein